MVITIGANISIDDPTPEVSGWMKRELVVPNPEYAKKQRMGFWTGKTPKCLYLYEQHGDSRYTVPYGLLKEVMSMTTDDDIIVSEFGMAEILFDWGEKIPLYDYQEWALKQTVDGYTGILQAPAGSGKTQVGIAIAQTIARKTLWVTHTIDLLNQSYDRAAQYIDKKKLGQITAGKVHIGSHITFATVQTLSAIDLTKYKDEWDVIIVDECHRVAGTPTSVSMFSKVLNSLRARHKFGLSATVHRADGLIKCTYSLLGEEICVIPQDAVADKIMTVQIQPVYTDAGLHPDCLNTDGTINFNGLTSYLTGWEPRNEQIVELLKENSEHYNLILSSRVDHLMQMMSMLDSEDAVLITGKMTSKKGQAERQQAIEDLRSGRKHFLFATFNLAKEGLDIPRLDRLFLTTPQKDYAVITQSVGRVARTFDGKETPIVYDFVDNINYCQRAYKKRLSSYRKLDAEIGDMICFR